MSNATFILDEHEQFKAIYVDGKKYGDTSTMDYNPEYTSTWFDLINSVRNFNEISVYHLTSTGIEKYSHSNSLPEKFVDFQKDELVMEINV